MWIPPKTKKGFFTVLGKILQCEISPTEKLVLIFIAKSSSKRGYCYMRLSKITEGVGRKSGDSKAGPDGKRNKRDEPTISRALRNLESNDYLRIEKCGNRFSFYALGHQLDENAPTNQDNKPPIEMINECDFGPSGRMLSDGRGCDYHNLGLFSQQSVVDDRTPFMVEELSTLYVDKDYDSLDEFLTDHPLLSALNRKRKGTLLLIERNYIPIDLPTKKLFFCTLGRFPTSHELWLHCEVNYSDRAIREALYHIAHLVKTDERLELFEELLEMVADSLPAVAEDENS